MFRPPKIFRREQRSCLKESEEPVPRRTLDYRSIEDEKPPRVPFWRDREGWKELLDVALGELVIGPLFLLIFAVVVWLVFRFLRS